MEPSLQIVKVTRCLTTPDECLEDTKLIMQSYVNWEEYLSPIPTSIGILAELIFISSNTDFSISKGAPTGGFKYIKHPDSFRACLMQVCNTGWHAFSEAHRNMDQIRLYTNNVPTYIKRAVQILLLGDDSIMQVMLPHQLDNICKIADDCLKLAQSTENGFTDVMKLIEELLESCLSAKGVYSTELKEAQKKIEENKQKNKDAEEANKRAEEAFKNMSKQLQEAQEMFNTSLKSMPSGWEIMATDIVDGVIGNVTTALSGIASMIARTATKMRSKEGETSVKPNENEDPISINNMYSKSPHIMALVECLEVFHEDQIKWHEIIDQKTKIKLIEDQFVIIQDSIKKEKDCKPKTEVLELVTKAIAICSELGNIKPEEKPDDAKTKEIVELMNSLRRESKAFDTESKSATNTPAFSIKQPQISQTQEQISGFKSAGRVLAENARFRIEQARYQLDKVRELSEQCAEDREKNMKALQEILISLRNTEVEKIDFSNNIKNLSACLGAMGNIKERWQTLVQFLKMISNIIKICMGGSLKEFAKTAVSTPELPVKYSSRMFLKDMIYNQAFHASNIASLVHMIAETYTDVSNKYLMDGVSKLSKLMTLDASEEELKNQRKLMAEFCSQADDEIRRLAKENKTAFDRKIKQRIEKIESELKAVLPPESEEKKMEAWEAIKSASKKDQDMDQLA